MKGLVERATGKSDLPLGPYFIYDSRLSGTSQHGAFWLGGPYVSENGWTPVIGEMVTNNPDDTDSDQLPRKIFISIRIPRLADTIDVEVTPGSAELGVTLAAAPNPVAAGDPLSVTVQVFNQGPDPASGLAAALSLPPDAIYVLGGGPSWSCELAGSDLTYDGATLEPGLTSQLDVLLYSPGTGGTRSLSACASAAEDDPEPANDCADAGVLIVDDAMTDLAIVKSDGDAELIPGAEITYSITVSNRGPNPAFGAIVEDVFPPDLLDVTWTCVASVDSSCTASGSGNILDTVDVAPDGTLLYLATATVAPTAVGPVTNTATVELPASMEDVVPGNNLSAVTTPSLIFRDGFETGDCARWSSRTGDKRRW